MVAYLAIFAPNYWMRFFAVIKRTLDAKVYQAMLAASRRMRIPQLNNMEWWCHQQECASNSELGIGETITCSQLDCSCTRVSSFDLAMSHYRFHQPIVR